jgi:hypothetical protein
VPDGRQDGRTLLLFRLQLLQQRLEVVAVAQGVKVGVHLDVGADRVTAGDGKSNSIFETEFFERFRLDNVP